MFRLMCDKLILSLLILLSLCGGAWGATYYVRADGTVLAANKANATSSSAAETSLNMAQVKIASFAAGDQILFSDKGGNYTEALALPSSGSGVGSEILYANVDGESPVITGNFNEMIYSNSKQYIIIRGFSVVFTGTSDYYGVRIRGSHQTFEGISVDMNGHGYPMIATLAVDDVTIDSCSLTNSKSTAASIYIYAASNGSVSILDTDATGGYGIDLRNMTNLSINGVTASRANIQNIPNGTIDTLNITTSGTITACSNFVINNLSAVAFEIINSSSAISVNNYTGNGSHLTIASSSSGVTVNDSEITNGSFITDTGASNVVFNDDVAHDCASGAGFIAKGTSNNIQYNRCIAYNHRSGFAANDSANNLSYVSCYAHDCTNLGFYSNGTTSNIVYDKCLAAWNGIVNVGSDGGGFIPHNGSTSVTIKHCIANDNYNVGFGDVSTGTNTFINNTSIRNGNGIGSVWKGVTVTVASNRANMYINKSGGVTTINNCIIYGSTLWDLILYGGSNTYSLDYNLYYPSDPNKFLCRVGTGDTPVTWDTYHNTQGSETHSINSNPNIISSSDYRLLSGSPAINAGTPWMAGTANVTDYAGYVITNAAGAIVPRCLGPRRLTRPDIGAYTYQSAGDCSGQNGMKFDFNLW